MGKLYLSVLQAASFSAAVNYCLTSFQIPERHKRIPTDILGLVHPMPEEFVNVGLTLKTLQMFPIYTLPDQLKKRLVILDLCVT